jgi:hypothetical protein
VAGLNVPFAAFVIPVPLHIPPATDAVKFTGRLPLQNGPAGVTATVVEFVTVTLIVLTAVHPFAVTVTVYTPVLAAVEPAIVGF